LDCASPLALSQEACTTLNPDPALGERVREERARGFMELKCRSCHGFSLIEMLITLALMLILMVMFYSRGSKSFQRRQREACQKNLQTIYVALQTYANEHDGLFPARDGARTSEEALAVLVPRYTSVTEPFTCPGTKKTPLPEGESFEKRRISYAYYMGRRVADAAEVLMTDEQINSLSKSEGEPVFSNNDDKPGRNHHKYGGNYLFCDGRTESSSFKTPFSLTFTQGIALLNPKP
jgi:prepilin-type N-terminal cleavage/methylation domain-containing protein